MDSFLVSVIIPVYNAEKFVAKAVKSASELHEVGEVILIEDGSSDNSLNICKELKRGYDKVILYQHDDKQNHGVSASRNLGIKRARFDYIAFLDADDYYLPNRFKKDKEILTTNSKIDGVYNALGIDYYTEKGKEIFLGAGFKYQEFLTLSDPVPPEELIFVLLNAHNVKGEFHGDCITLRKEVLQKVGFFNTNLILNEDTHLWIRIAAKYLLKNGEIKNPVAIRGVHDNNTLIKKWKQPNAMDIWYKSLLYWFRNNGIDKTVQNRLKQNYISYISIQKPTIKAILPSIHFFVNNRSLICKKYGFFDIIFFNLFGRNKFSHKIISAKNKILRSNE